MVRQKTLQMITIATGILALAWGVMSNQASIDYWFDTKGHMVRGTDWIIVNCYNGGNADGEFKLIITLVNATFSLETEQPYEKIDDGIYSFRFLLHKEERHFRKMYFTLDEGVQSFQISVDAKKTNTIYPVKLNPMYPITVFYVWSEDQNGFIYTE